VLDWPTMPALYNEGLGAPLLGVWQRWDACWYLRIATFGYEPGDAGAAFFPLYPLLVGITGPLFLGNLVVAALVVSGIAYVIAMTLLHAMVSEDFDGPTADRSILYLSIFPTAFFFFAPFTEALFLALAVGAIHATRKGHYGFALVAAFLAGLTRPQGILLAIPLAWLAWQVLHRGRLAAGYRLASVGAIVSTVAPVLGFLLFLAVSSAFLGVTPSEAVRGHWGYSWSFPWEVLGRAWAWATDQANAGFANIQLMTAFHLFLIGLFVALLAVGLRRLPVVYSLYVAPQLLLLVSGGPATPLASASRYMLAMFPIFVVAGLLGEDRKFHLAWVVFSLLGLGLLFLAILTNFPVG
jgi:hypothetical protein